MVLKGFLQQVLDLSGRENVCRKGRDRRFAKYAENEFPADGVPEQLKCRHDLKARERSRPFFPFSQQLVGDGDRESFSA